MVICGTNEATLKRASDELGTSSFRADVSREQDVEALFEFALKEMGGLNVLVNNAGIDGFSPLTDTPLHDFERIWAVNVKGAFVAGRRAARHFIPQNTRNIINIGSTASLRGFANGSAYVASTVALLELAECWRAELRPHNVRVMQINPSEVVTEFAPRAGMATANTERKLRPSEIAHVLRSMLSMNDVDFITDASVWATTP